MRRQSFVLIFVSLNTYAANEFNSVVMNNAAIRPPSREPHNHPFTKTSSSIAEQEQHKMQNQIPVSLKSFNLLAPVSQPKTVQFSQITSNQQSSTSKENAGIKISEKQDQQVSNTNYQFSYQQVSIVSATQKAPSMQTSYQLSSDHQPRSTAYFDDLLNSIQRKLTTSKQKLDKADLSLLELLKNLKSNLTSLQNELASIQLKQAFSNQKLDQFQVENNDHIFTSNTINSKAHLNELLNSIHRQIASVSQKFDKLDPTLIGMLKFLKYNLVGLQNQESVAWMPIKQVFANQKLDEVSMKPNYIISFNNPTKNNEVNKGIFSEKSSGAKNTITEPTPTRQPPKDSNLPVKIIKLPVNNQNQVDKNVHQSNDSQHLLPIIAVVVLILSALLVAYFFLRKRRGMKAPSPDIQTKKNIRISEPSPTSNYGYKVDTYLNSPPLTKPPPIYKEENSNIAIDFQFIEGQQDKQNNETFNQVSDKIEDCERNSLSIQSFLPYLKASRLESIEQLPENESKTLPLKESNTLNCANNPGRHRRKSSAINKQNILPVTELINKFSSSNNSGEHKNNQISSPKNADNPFSLLNKSSEELRNNQTFGAGRRHSSVAISEDRYTDIGSATIISSKYDFRNNAKNSIFSDIESNRIRESAFSSSDSCAPYRLLAKAGIIAANANAEKYISMADTIGSY